MRKKNRKFNRVCIDIEGNIALHKKKGIFDILHYFPKQTLTKYDTQDKDFLSHKTNEQKVLWKKESRKFQRQLVLDDLYNLERKYQLKPKLSYAMAILALFLFNKKFLPFGIAYQLAVGVDTTGADQTTGARSSVTITLTLASGDTLLIAGTCLDYAASTLSGVYNSLALTQFFWDASLNGTACHYRANPTSGTHDVVMSTGDAREAIVGVIAFTGSATAPSGLQTQDSSGTSSSLTVTSSTSSYVMDIIYTDTPAGSGPTSGWSSTDITNGNVTGGGGGAWACGYKAGAASVNTTRSWNTSQSFGYNAWNIAPAPVIANSAFLTFMGPQPRQ